METSNDSMKMCIFVISLCIATLVGHCDSRRSMRLSDGPKHYPKTSISKHTKTLRLMKHFDVDMTFRSTNTDPYRVSSPFSLPPYNSLAPVSLPDDNASPLCIYSPPFTPQPPSTTIPTPPMGYNPPPPPPVFYIPPILPIENPPPDPSEVIPSPPESSFIPNPPQCNPNPPETVPSPPETSFSPNPPEAVPTPPESSFNPNPPEIVPTPPESYPSPPETIPSPPESSFNPNPPESNPNPPSYGQGPPSYYTPSPSAGFVPSPVFQPPVVFPPPAVPPPPQRGQTLTLWCVAKPTVPDPMIEETMNYACGSGADCMSIQPSGSCFEPNTLYAHASYAFNSYWHRTKVAGGSCEFGGTAILVTVDPSFDGCHFMYY